MKQTILALALLLAAPVIGLAAPSSEEPALLTVAPLALCAATPATGVLQVNPEQDSSVGAAVVTCSSYCGHGGCLGRAAGFPCILGPGKAGTCTPAADYCSTDGIKRCFCDWSPEW